MADNLPFEAWLETELVKSWAVRQGQYQPEDMRGIARKAYERGTRESREGIAGVLEEMGKAIRASAATAKGGT